MAMLDQIGKPAARSEGFPELCRRVWNRPVSVIHAGKPPVCRLECEAHELTQVWQWLIQELDFAFATLVVEEEPSGGRSLAYVFYRRDAPWVCVELQLPPETSVTPSVVGLTQGPSADWHEREAEDLFGIAFEGHPRLGEFILHEDWPEGVNPMRRTFDPRQPPVHRDPDAKWQPPTVVEAPGAFAMPIGPVFSDFAESVHFLLETVGEDVIRTIPRLFYKAVSRRLPRERQSIVSCFSPNGSPVRPPSRTDWLFAKPSSRSAESKCRRVHERSAPCLPNSNGCDTTQPRSPAFATRRHWRSRPARRR
jgi:Ni,Fe-hydrogenase III component G